MKRQRHIPQFRVAAPALAAAWFILCSPAARAGFASQGQGIQTVVSGSVTNGAIYWHTENEWVNGSTPDKPYHVTVPFSLPPCQSIAVARLVMTIWGGNANYVCQMTVTINGTSLAGVAPLVFGGTGDANPVFRADVPCAYGSGSGLWLVTVPVPAALLATDGSPNAVQITQTTSNGFDGRLHHVTLAAVYQSVSLANSFDYVLAEGSGDIYKTPVNPQTDARTVSLDPVTPANATAAQLRALYTYGDTGQNDRLFFNGHQLGSDDVAGWDKVGSGLDYGPSVVSFHVLPWLQASNTVKFSVAAADVPGTRETSLRPQLAALGVTHDAAKLVAVRNGDNLDLTVTAVPGQSCTIMESRDLIDWSELIHFTLASAPVQQSVPIIPGNCFYRVKTP